MSFLLSTLFRGMISLGFPSEPCVSLDFSCVTHVFPFRCPFELVRRVYANFLRGSTKAFLFPTTFPPDACLAGDKRLDPATFWGLTAVRCGIHLNLLHDVLQKHCVLSKKPSWGLLVWRLPFSRRSSQQPKHGVTNWSVERLGGRRKNHKPEISRSLERSIGYRDKVCIGRGRG